MHVSLKSCGYKTPYKHTVDASSIGVLIDKEVKANRTIESVGITEGQALDAVADFGLYYLICRDDGKNNVLLKKADTL